MATWKFSQDNIEAILLGLRIVKDSINPDVLQAFESILKNMKASNQKYVYLIGRPK